MSRGKFRVPRPSKCVRCGTDFVRFSSPEVTCSDVCRLELKQQRWTDRRLTKGCARCGIVKPLSEYSGTTTAHCKDCFNQGRRDRFTAHDYRLMNLRKYRLTSEGFDLLLAGQGGRCAICRTSEPGGKHGNWHVDHDHSCCPGPRSCGACVRGILCHNCNLFLGNARDSAAILRAAIAYLDRPRQPALIT